MARSHKYVMRTGTPGNYRYWYDMGKYKRHVYNYARGHGYTVTRGMVPGLTDRTRKHNDDQEKKGFGYDTAIRHNPIKRGRLEIFVKKYKNKAYSSISSISKNVKIFADNLVNKARNVAYSAIASLGHFGKKVKTRLEKESKHWDEIKRADRNAGSKLNRYGSAF